MNVPLQVSPDDAQQEEVRTTSLAPPPQSSLEKAVRNLCRPYATLQQIIRLASSAAIRQLTVKRSDVDMARCKVTQCRTSCGE